ncbi:MAG: LysR family transcriptional regulator [Aquimonas sp.]|nr:LysR family transcriptional regulator [Aquimonas sp.]
MERLNYRQLQQFWAVARAGSLRAAAEQLDLAPQTLSSQIAVLEHSLGTALFQRVGRRLELTEAGRMVRSYADEIFGLGDELLEAVGEARLARVRPLRVGVAEVVPKSLAYELLSPALALEPAPRLQCREDSLPRLLAELALHRLDLVISDHAPQGEYEIKVHATLLGECGTAILAAPALAEPLRAGFPRSLHGAPMLMPGVDSRVRAGLQRWLDTHKLRPRIVAEFEDSALMKAFGAAGAGFFAVPAVVAADLCTRQGMVEIGRVEDLRQRFHALAGPRRSGHPGVQAVLEAARDRLFADA